MMELSERFGWLVFGMAIGFVLGFIVAQLRSIEKKVETVDEHFKQSKEDERGFMRIPLVADVLYFLVLVIVVWSAIASQKTSNEVEVTQDCIKLYNERQAAVLKGRDEAIQAGTQSEIDLWVKYERLYKIAKEDPKKIPALQDALYKAIIKHRESLEELQSVRETFEYPPSDVIENCEENNSD